MRIGYSILAFFFLLLALMPQIASTPVGKPLFIRILSKKTKSEIEFESSHFSWLGPQKFHNIHWTHESANGTLEELKIKAPFWSFKGLFELKNGSIDYKGGRVEQIEGKVEGKKLVLNGITQGGHISVQGDIESRKQFHLNVDIKQFPLAALDSQLDQIFGPVLDVSGTIDFSQKIGELNLAITAPNLRTQLRGSMSSTSFTLKEPLIATFFFTPKNSAILLKNSYASFTSQTPTTLRIEPQNFYYPLPFSWKKLKIHKAILDLSKIKCNNNPSLSVVMMLLKADSLAKADELSFWFSPVMFQIDSGQFELGRIDFLISNTIHLCTWGTADLLTEKLNFILGLPAETLRQSFGIKNVDVNYVLKVEVRGSAEEPNIATGPAVAKIAALVAASQIPKKGLLGELTDFFPKFKADKDTPPPKRPFPWEKNR